MKTFRILCAIPFLAISAVVVVVALVFGMVGDFVWGEK
jgi:hypothetical protein